MIEDRNEEEPSSNVSVSLPQITHSDDHDATWVRKGIKPHYGYKAHVAVDTTEGFILGGHMTSAILPIPRSSGTSLRASRYPKHHLSVRQGYASQKNRNLCAARGYEDAIMHKAARGKPLTFFQRFINRIISSVPLPGGTGHGDFEETLWVYPYALYGLKKGNMEFLLNAMAFTLKKAARMIET